MAPVPLRRTATRPDSPRSRFIQLVSSTPPYASTPSWRTPARTTSGWGLMRRLGLSVWAPTMRKPSWGLWPAAVAHATRVPPRTTNQRPGSPGHAASSASRVNPASVSSADAVAQAWYGEGEASQNASRRRAGSRSTGRLTDRRAYRCRRWPRAITPARGRRRHPASPRPDRGLAAPGPDRQDAAVALPAVDLVIVHRDAPDAVLRTVGDFLGQSLVPRIVVVDNDSSARRGASASGPSCPPR